MEQQTIGGITASSLTFEGLEPHFRGKIREWMQALLVEEVTEFLGRGKSERKPVAERKGYRNGYGKERHLTTAMGTIAVRGPRPPGVDGELVGSVAGPFVPRSALSETDHRRRPPGDLGGGAQRLPGGRGAAVLEPPDRE